METDSTAKKRKLDEVEGGSSSVIQVGGLTVREVHPHGFGCEVLDEDLDLKNMSAQQMQAFKDLMDKYDVIVVHGQDFPETVDQVNVITSLQPHNKELIAKGHGNNFDTTDHPLVRNSVWPSEKYVKVVHPGYAWHVDGIAWSETPIIWSCLHCIKAPKKGGETLFASSVVCYDLLDEAVKAKIDRLTAEYYDDYQVHGWKLDWFGTHRTDDVEETRQLHAAEGTERSKRHVTHPLVHVSKDGKKSIYTGNHTLYRFIGPDGPMTPAETHKLTGEILTPGVQPEHVFVMRWKPNDVAFFNNRRMLHSPTIIERFKNEERHIKQCFLPAIEKVKSVDEAEREGLIKPATTSGAQKTSDASTVAASG
ncbi:unnamed protein product [Vitrella brassicaformis CCMP3155]|uniref:TauD/TfdA-like domain-containing protein n=1 Tax=Vitrella brassicaformis (strain CCMP3155) TaxID=1169540 RepID=A0A0G4FHI9_VITBC|nr:unnamed protein product [Vitrella brassicaformis CCMP3155]|eukprot:CEM12979.1 unnamed protein product [Vitrella brassicaformis CCMP3155]